MVKCERKHIFMDMIKDGLSYLSQIVSAAISPLIAEGTEMVMKTIEKRIIYLKKRIARNIFSLLMISFGSIFLIFALFFFLIENLSLTKSASFFYIGIIIFVLGLLLRLFESDR